LFAAHIARTAKDIEILIDSLPADDQSTEEIEKQLVELDEERAEAVANLRTQVEQAEILVGRIGEIISTISTVQLKSRPLVP
jgi:mediator of RNA polymerase II transcription subunit 21